MHNLCMVLISIHLRSRLVVYSNLIFIAMKMYPNTIMITWKMTKRQVFYIAFEFEELIEVSIFMKLICLIFLKSILIQY